MMNLHRQFAQIVGNSEIIFDVDYDMQTHGFIVKESVLAASYRLNYHPETKTWSTEGLEPSISVDALATLVQNNYGHFVS